MPPTVSIVIPVYNAAPYLAECLDGLRRLDPRPLECLLVDDGSTDDSVAIAERAGFRVLSCGRRRGPAVARNVGARAARGEILLFVDSDVLVSPGAVARVLARLVEDPSRDAIIGSYDDRPGSPDFTSQYRNLLHCFTHQSSYARTCSFWTGCGAIRTRVFREHGGFSEAYDRPYLEDIEMGLRLRRAGREIWLDKGLCVKHLKRLTFAQTLKTDLFDRAIPWTLLILRFRSMPADLNLRWEQRLSVLLVSSVAAAVALGAVLGITTSMPLPPWPYWAGVAAVAAALLAILNRGFYRFLANRRGLWFALRSFPLHCLYFFSSGLGFAIGVLSYALRSSVPLPARRQASTNRDA